MNKYLEKIAQLEKTALNAQKLRAMAKKVGVVVDQDSAWKWALRGLRNGRGEALVGKELAQKRIKLGDISNNAYQKISGAERKLASNTELATTIDNKTGGVSAPTASGEIRSLSISGPIMGGNTLHTHPRVADQAISGTRESIYRMNHLHRHASPSGFYPGTWDRRLHTMLQTPKYKKLQSNMYTNSERLSNVWIAADKSKNKVYVDKANRIADKILNRIGTLRDRMPPGYPHFENLGDMTHFRTQPGGIQRVVSPSTHTVSATKLNKTIGGPPRIVYFDHTPRNVK